MGLPTTKTTPKKSFTAQTLMIVGQPKIGKSSLAADLYPEAIWLTTEDGHKHLSIYEYQCKSWSDFAVMANDLIKGGHANYSALVIDILDHLVDFASDQVCLENDVKALADLKFGKGTELLKKKLMRPILMLSRLMPLVFITHQKDRIQKDKGIEWTVSRTSMAESVEKQFTGMCDIILNCYQDEDGQRVMRTKPTKYLQAAGDRTGKLPAKLPLSAKALRQAYTVDYDNEILDLKEKTDKLLEKVGEDAESKSAV